MAAASLAVAVSNPAAAASWPAAASQPAAASLRAGASSLAAGWTLAVPAGDRVAAMRPQFWGTANLLLGQGPQRLLSCPAFWHRPPPHPTARQQAEVSREAEAAAAAVEAVAEAVAVGAVATQR